MLHVPTRRGLIAGLASLIAAPAVIRVADLMPVKASPRLIVTDFRWREYDISAAAIHKWEARQQFLQQFEQEVIAAYREVYDVR